MLEIRIILNPAYKKYQVNLEINPSLKTGMGERNHGKWKSDRH